ncbi:hypothetical protein ACQCSX_22885 (plasmid) [Pseudarthrobacter sp. P1]|uniref:hypothetical protein n=1 Tax=Pseudarthrobacter sp. P1 TaxID=3418418 RepID=UPI003CEAA87C
MTPSVITRVRNFPGVAWGPLDIRRRWKTAPDLVGAADVEIVADDLFEEDPPRDRGVEHLGQGELGLQHRQVIPVARGPVGIGERIGQNGQPLAQQRVDFLAGQPVADPLQRGRVLDRGEGVVQGGEPESGLARLVLGPVVAIDAQLCVVGEV